jgi:hypothetical protein
MKARTWLVLVAMMAVAGTGIAQQAPMEVVCPAGKILIEGKCKAAPHPKQGIEPSTPRETAPPGGSHVPVCKGDEVVKDGKCVPGKD